MNCLCCHAPVSAAGAYHQKCLKSLFGVTYVPELTFGISDLPAKVGQVAGRMSISGAQIKASVRLNPANKQLEIVADGGTHILKPEPDGFAELPQNENLVMNMAASLGLRVPPHGLVRLADGRFAYIIKRFDRLPSGRKTHKEDMAQLLGLSPEAKYTGASLEAVGNVIRAHSANPFLDLFDFFQRIVFNFAVGNGDLHLKNWSLLTPENGQNSLAPCYDFVCSKIYLKDEQDSALALRGKRNKLARADFEDFAAYLELDPKAAANALNSIVAAAPRFFELARASFLSPERRHGLNNLLEERLARLSAR